MKTLKYIQNKLLVHMGSRKYLAPADILYLESDLNYTNIWTKDGDKILSSTTLGIIGQRLLPFKNFVRINRQSIVNLDWVEKTENNAVLLRNKRQLAFSRRRAKAFFI